MTEAHLDFLKSRIDQVVALETIHGEHLLARILFIFDEGDTPDLFCLEVAAGPDGAYVQKGSNGLSILLSDIATAQPA
jgi:hypothetical protein